MHVTAEWGGMRGRQPSRRKRERAGIIIVVIIIIDTPLDMVGGGKRREERGEGVMGVESVSPVNGSTRPDPLHVVLRISPSLSIAGERTKQ